MKVHADSMEDIPATGYIYFLPLGLVLPLNTLAYPTTLEAVIGSPATS